jgi:uncharacterized protein (DUF983 family)
MTARATGVESIRVEVVGSCPECGSGRLARYAVLSEGGWFLVLKCQNCLHSLERASWRALGDVSRLGVD